MAVSQNGGPPLPKDILAYNSNSDRGWNDPPTLAFASSSSSTPRKRLDLRKRVAHGCVSGTQIINSGMQNLNLNQQQPIVNMANQHDTMNMKPGSNLDTNNVVNYNRSTSVGHKPINGSSIYNDKQSFNSNMLPGFMTPPVMQNSNFPEPSHHLVHSASMPNLQHEMNGELPQQNGLVPSKAPIFQPPTLGNTTYPMQLQSPWNKPLVSHENASSTQSIDPASNSSHVGNPLFFFSGKDLHPAVANAVSTATSNLRSSAEIDCVAKTQTQNTFPEDKNAVQLNTTMPECSKNEHEHSHHVRSSSLPNFEPLPNSVSPGQTLAAPPVDGYYTKRASSACSSRQRTPSPEISRMAEAEDNKNNDNDNEKFNSVIEKLNCAIEKCSASTEQKVLDDVKKRVDIFRKNWHENVLSVEVKSKMNLLSKAISDQEYEEAEKIHQSLIVDYSSEVRQWMVGIKKLISLCKQKAAENNKN